MIDPTSAGIPLGGNGLGDPHQRLRKAAHDFEALFVSQLFKEMRASAETDEEGLDPGHEMFADMLDEAVANETAKHSSRGLGEAMYRQLAARLDQTTERPKAE